MAICHASYTKSRRFFSSGYMTSDRKSYLKIICEKHFSMASILFAAMLCTVLLASDVRLAYRCLIYLLSAANSGKLRLTAAKYARAAL